MVWRNFSWAPVNLGHPKQLLCQIKVVNVRPCMNHAISAAVRCLAKLLMALMVDITLFMSLFSIYVIPLNLSKIQVNINGYSICPDCGACFNCGPGRAASQLHA